MMNENDAVMPVQAIFVVLSNPVEGREDEFNRWYDEDHIPDILALDGFSAATRFRLADAQRPGADPSPYRYLALYEIEGETRMAVNGLARALEEGMHLSEALSEHRLSCAFESLGPRRTAS